MLARHFSTCSTSDLLKSSCFSSLHLPNSVALGFRAILVTEKMGLSCTFSHHGYLNNPCHIIMLHSGNACNCGSDINQNLSDNHHS